MRCGLFGWSVVLLLVSPLVGDDGVGSDVDASARLFTVKVLPLLKHKCLVCHGDDPEDVRGEFDMRSRAALLKGGESGEPSLVPGKAAESPLFTAMQWTDEFLRMPPKENDRLTNGELELVRRWIAAGAPWPDDATRARILKAERSRRVTEDGVLVDTSGGLSDDWTYRRYRPEALWAYRSVARPDVPIVEGAGDHPIDAFLAKRLRETGLILSAPAERSVWLRRITFDLTGLPPTPAELDAFLADEGANARATVIDRLLASPRYGERMAQHWLDVARYADTAGFSNDFERPTAWRYRDYVIRSFNADKPFDDFVREQIAGDELRPNDPEARIAVGFLRMGPWEHTAMSVAAVTRQQFLDDVTNAVGETFLGHSLRCAKCHDHKFDPIPTRDYYAMQAVFATTQFEDTPAPFLEAENTADFDRLREELAARTNAKPADWMRTDQPSFNSTSRVRKKREAYLKLEAQRTEPKAFGVRVRGDQQVRILVGGALESPADPVGPGVLSAVGLTRGGTPFDVPQQRDGRRRALAEWIADDRNPLTARVFVNRVWQMHFGRGLVATPNNFGGTGAVPSHPELLDWLAAWFVENGWSTKKLHRLIITSGAYALSTEPGDAEATARVDPDNVLLGHFPPRRLTAEELRDAMLAVTGELRTTMGGPGIQPAINWEVALQPRHVMGGTAPAYVPSPRKRDRHRRTIYAYRIRTLADPTLEVFNKPGPDASCERRDETTVTPQVFALFNGAPSHARALALANRLAGDHEELDGRITAAYRLLFARPPTERELAACRTHVNRMTAHHSAREPERTELPQWVDREMIDEQTGLTYRWSERLEGMERYERDVQPWEVAADVRGLAELCLVLLNANEFVYVY